MDTKKTRSVVWHVVRSKDMVQLLGNLNHSRPKGLKGKRVHAMDYSRDESSVLIGGELSDGRREVKKPIPKGYVPVYVGEEGKRFVIPARYLSMPDFRLVMEKVSEEEGYEHEGGGLRIICCEEQDFEELLTRCSSAMRKNKPLRPTTPRSLAKLVLGT